LLGFLVSLNLQLLLVLLLLPSADEQGYQQGDNQDANSASDASD